MTASVATGNAAQAFDLSVELDSARKHVTAGRLDQAMEACRRILEHRSDQPGAFALVGLTALKAGDTARAIEAFDKATSIRPVSAEYQMLLGRACLAAGRHTEAIAAFTRMHEILPAEPEPLMLLGKAEMAIGNRAEGTAHVRAAMQLAKRRAPRALVLRFLTALAPLHAVLAWPAHPRRGFGCAVALRRSDLAARYGNPRRAHEFLRAAIAANPHDDAAYVRLARGENKVRGWGAAVAVYEQASENGIDSVDLDTEHAFTLARLGRPLEARAMLERALAAKPEHRAALCMMAYVHRLLAKTEDAEQIYRRVLARHRSDFSATYGIGRCKMDLGETDEAEAWLKRTIQMKSDHGPAWRGLARIGRLPVDGDHFKRLLARLDDPELATDTRSSMHMAAGMVLDRAKQHDEAFAHFAAGNRLTDVAFSPDAFDQHIDHLIRAYDTDFFARMADGGSDSETPVFIVGVPRSSTSLTEQILASHAMVFGVGELDCFNVMVDRLAETLGSAETYPDCVDSLDAATAQSLAEGYLAELHERCDGDFQRITDKMPGNFLHVGLIAAIFPHARIIHCRRDPMDTCLSIFFQRFSGHHPYAYDLYKLGRYYRSYERLMAHWHKVLPGRILDMRYDELIADQRGKTEELLSFCGLDWDDACLEFHRTKRSVRTASNAQVRQPINTKSLDRWKAYEAHLAPLKAGLEGR